MKKLYFMAVAAMAALSSCTSDNDLELNQNTGKEALTFTATIEDSEATRVTFDNDKSRAVWEVNDQISINGKTYSAQTAGTTSTFTAVGDGATGTTYNAYFPADLYDGTTATLPAIQTYEAGKFNMPMYATSENTTELQFYNLCAVLAIKVTSADIAKLKSIKVASDQKMNGSFTVTDNKAVINDENGTNVVVLESSEAITLTETGTTFYIAIPAQDYKYLNIFLSSDGKNYTQAMATKKAAGLGTIARSKMFNIDYTKNATKLWKGNLFIADCNVGATSPTEYGGLYTWGGTNDARSGYIADYNEGKVDLSPTSDPITDTATKLWGSNWRMPTSTELETLLSFKENWDDTKKGLLCTSKSYAGNNIFLPAAGIYNFKGELTLQSTEGYYWSSTYSSGPKYENFDSVEPGGGYTLDLKNCYSVRAVLDEAEGPATVDPDAPDASTTRGKAYSEEVGSDVNWVQLWKDGPKFAEYNVGVTDGKAESFGGCYTWGGTHKNGEGITWDGTYNTGTDALSGETDTATKFWGSNWRMPTKAELDALISFENCTWDWIEDYNGTGVNGLLFTGKDDYKDNSIFLPAADGCYSDEDGLGFLEGYGLEITYWASSTATFLHFAQFYSGDEVPSTGDFDRDYTCSVRAVLAE